MAHKSGYEWSTNHTSDYNTGHDCSPLPPKSSKKQLCLAFFAGFIACGTIQLGVYSRGPGHLAPFSANQSPPSVIDEVKILGSPDAGSTEVHHYPPISPTNVNPTLFPSNVGYPGGTATGAEPAVILTAPSYPVQTGAAQLVKPDTLGDKAGDHKGKWSADFDIFKKWGTLSPWYSVGRGAFGVDSDPTVPKTCRVTGLHLLHRHGARYPTRSAESPSNDNGTLYSYGGPTILAGNLHKAPTTWTATGKLEFLNEWTYKLGEEVLTPFGRQQLYDLGVSMRLKYGFLLKNSTATNSIPVFRTESQDRMLQSALNFALGFFGYPLEGKYQQSITIEKKDISNSLAPYYTCPNALVPAKGFRGAYYVKRWADIYLKAAHDRLKPDLKGYALSIEEVYIMQQISDLSLWYEASFGSPVARVQGYGWVKEFIARLTREKIHQHNPATNSTLDNDPTTFPLDHSLYVDATHEVVVLEILTALNLANFARSGPLPYTHILKNRSFEASKLAPFATNVQFQLLDCTSVHEPQIRIIVNDGVVPLTSIKGCGKQSDGMCPLKAFIKAQKERLEEIDWDYECKGNWSVPPGPAWSTTSGSPPPKPPKA
ncbi:hypothetical protein C0991_009915 [Blastosporella zonata]|nr:hypothetical protein C0991_009915 [Blastosporella zonata]